MSNFDFLQAEWGLVFEAAQKAEHHAHSDARSACFYARRALELAVSWLYTHDKALKLPYPFANAGWPLLGQGNALASKFDVLADYLVEDFERLISLLAWLESNPKSGLYDNLRAHTWGQRVRLEQERLGWHAAMGTLVQTLCTPTPSGLDSAPAIGPFESTA